MIAASEKSETEYVPLDFGKVLEFSLRYWIKNLKSFYVIFSLIQLGVLSAAYGAFFLSGSDWFVAQISQFLGAQIPFWLITAAIPSPLVVGLDILLIIVFVINFVVQTILGGMVTRHTADYHAKLAPTLNESYRETRSRFWSLLGAQILVVLILAGILIGMSMLMLVLGIGLLFVWGFLGVFVGIAIGGILMFIVTLYVTVHLAVVTPSVIIGGASAGGSLGRSWRLVRGNWWRTFAITLIVVILTGAIGMPTSLVLGSLMSSFWFPSMTLLLIVAYIVVSAVIIGFTTPIGTATSTMIYHDLRGREYTSYVPGEPRALHSYTECPVCKRPVSPNERFCGQCGRELDID
ncbi:MAG: zinc ribbon domain-containing protein [Promethearchaeota archaeon]